MKRSIRLLSLPLLDLVLAHPTGKVEEGISKKTRAWREQMKGVEESYLSFEAPPPVIEKLKNYFNETQNFFSFLTAIGKTRQKESKLKEEMKELSDEILITASLIPVRVRLESDQLQIGAFYMMSGVLSFSLVITLLVVMGLSRWITTPILSLTKSVQAFRDGDLSVRSEAHGKDELGTLFEAFDEMGRKIENTTGELEVALSKAQQASQAKTEFLGSMSHELRTPLNAIIGFSELLIEELGNGFEYTEDLEKIQWSGRHLLTIVNDVLDITKIEADQISLEYEPFSIGPFVDHLKMLTEPLIKSKDLKLSWEVSPEINQIVGDDTRLTQVLSNLLSNAIKFTHEGFVKFSCFLKEFDGDKFIIFTVEDSGIGMTESQLERVFQPFIQADNSTTRVYGGTGLGLAISDRIVEMMKGKIDVVSEISKGSRFIVQVPYLTNTQEALPFSVTPVTQV